MRRGIRIAIAAAALLGAGALAAPPALADGGHGHRKHWKKHGWRGHGHGHHHHGPVVRSGIYFGVGPAYGWYGWGGPRYVYDVPPPVVVYRQPRIVIEEPPVYVQRTAPPRASEGWWYYCRSERAYYPDVPACPEPWVRVAPEEE